MLARKPIFPNVLEMNVQAGQLIGCNVYLIHDGDEWALIDIGYQDSVEEIIELIRQMDFPLSKCKTLIATHADVDHGQGFAAAKQILKTSLTAHPKAARLLAEGDRLQTFAEVEAQGISMEMPKVTCEHLVQDGDVIKIGSLELEVSVFEFLLEYYLVFVFELAFVFGSQLMLLLYSELAFVSE